MWFCLVYFVGFVYFGLFSYTIEDDLKIKSTREDITDLALTELKFTHFSHFFNRFLPARFEIKLRLKFIT